MSLELTKNKSNIGSGALNDLVFTLYCCVIGQWLPTRRRLVGNQSAISWGAIGNRSAIGRRLVGDCILSVCFWLQKVCNFLEIGRQPIGDWSAISRRLKTVSGLSATAATGRRSVANQSGTCRQPVGDHQKPFYDRFGCREVSLAATKISLRPNRPCNRLQPVGDQSPTSLQPPCNLSATTLNFDRKEVADRLQAMWDRGFRGAVIRFSSSCFGWLWHTIPSNAQVVWRCVVHCLTHLIVIHFFLMNTHNIFMHCIFRSSSHVMIDCILSWSY